MCRGLLAVLILPCLLSCAGVPVPSEPKPASSPETLALAWIARCQESDGSFPTEEYLPREIGTALVVGLLASVKGRAVDLDPVLHHSVKYFGSLQSPDGAFRYSKCPDVFMNTSLTLMALFACRDRDTDSYRADGSYVEIFDPRLLVRFFRRCAKSTLSWDEFLEEQRSAAPSFDNPELEPEDMVRAARKAFASKDLRACLNIRAWVLDGQSPEGSWDSDGPSAGRKIVGAAYRIRTLELLQGVLADTLVRR